MLDDSVQYEACHDCFEEQAQNMFSNEIYDPEYDVTVNTMIFVLLIYLHRIAILHGHRGVIEAGQQVPLDIAHLGGVTLEAIQHEAQVVPVQPQQAVSYQGLRHLVARRITSSFSPRSPRRTPLTPG